MPLLSLAHFTVIDADPIELIDAGAAGGFDAVGLRIVAPVAADKIVEVVGDAPLQRPLIWALPRYHSNPGPSRSIRG